MNNTLAVPAADINEQLTRVALTSLFDLPQKRAVGGDALLEDDHSMYVTLSFHVCTANRILERFVNV